MTGCLHMHNRNLNGIPTPLDSEKDHAANVDYVRRKKRSLEVVVGEEEDNNGGETGGGTEGGGESGGGSGGGGGGSGSGPGGSGGGNSSGSSGGVEESVTENDSGDRVFRISKRDLLIQNVGPSYSIPWAEEDYTPSVDEMKQVIQLYKSTQDRRYTRADIYARGLLSYKFTFEIPQGKGEFVIFDNKKYTETPLDFSKTKFLSGSFDICLNNLNDTQPSFIRVSTPAELEVLLNGKWSWELTFTVKQEDLPKSF